MKRFIRSLKFFLGHIFLKTLPLFSFPYLNNMIFRFMGYNLDKSVKIYSSAQILGNIIVKIGKDTFIGHETIIMGGNSTIIIGKNCDISSRVNIISGTHKIDMHGQRSAGDGIGKDIVISDGVWIGFGASVLPGITIGEKSIIGAGSVVTKDIPAYTIAVGNPCKPIRRWSFDSQSYVNVT